MNHRYRTARITAAAALAASAVALTGCTAVQDTFQVGQREFFYPTSAAAEESGESFRFQGFLPDDATDVRLLAQLDGHAALMRWTSATHFDSEHCTTAPVTSEPELHAQWLPDSLPETGFACGAWTVVRTGNVHIAWPDTSTTQ